MSILFIKNLRQNYLPVFFGSYILFSTYCFLIKIKKIRDGDIDINDGYNYPHTSLYAKYRREGYRYPPTNIYESCQINDFNKKRIGGW